MKKYYYIGIICSTGIQLVTKLDNSTKTWVANIDDKPLAFNTKTSAENVAEGMFYNMVPAVIIESFCELHGHPYVPKTD